MKLLLLTIVTVANLGIVLAFEGYPLVRVLFATMLASNWYFYGYMLGQRAADVKAQVEAFERRLDG